MRNEFIDTVELLYGKLKRQEFVIFILHGDPELITDLCEINKVEYLKYDYFGGIALKYLEVVAISIRDFQNQEMAILLRENSWLVFMDDKHQCKVGESGYPVAAVERRRQVIVSKIKLFNESFYKGQVYVGLKDSIIQPSDPLRHIAEL
ncbi:uncharacterized protein LOC105334625 [Rhizophagus clarus]|uniref:Uncharacterized protein LOC105334625 n=1 Tax=Rhizophagus clarus TaxID=94130 RepID=A0A8H3QZL7_9GLOM|nr:uncharacterized protein LOC105334625 [Rhizophagus clarus]